MTDYFHLHAADDDVKAISSLGLAHLGDGVFELMVRSWLCLHGKATSKGLHRATVKYVAAPAQAERVERILPLLTQEEAAVFRRGRNTAPHSVPKAGTKWRAAVQEGFERQIPLAQRSLPILAAELGGHAPLIGAAEDLLDYLEDVEAQQELDEFDDVEDIEASDELHNPQEHLDMEDPQE